LNWVDVRPARLPRFRPRPYRFPLRRRRLLRRRRRFPRRRRRRRRSGPGSVQLRGARLRHGVVTETEQGAHGEVGGEAVLLLPLEQLGKDAPKRPSVGLRVEG
jgi:hypothetical protein